MLQHSSDKTIVGTWITLEDNTKIQIVEEKGMLIGKIKSSDNPNAQVGKLILKDLVKSGNTWTGKIFAVEALLRNFQGAGFKSILTVFDQAFQDGNLDVLYNIYFNPSNDWIEL